MKNNYRQSLKLALTFALLIYYSPIFSQNLPQKSISGTITDAGGPLSGVNVLVKNTSRGTTSDLEGRYSLTATVNDTLVFTYLGYMPQEVAVGNNYAINLLMAADATALDQVVINAGYYKVSDREKTGSISRITAKEIENQPVSNPLAAMQGRLAGVAISQDTGVPGGGFHVRIRGQNSIAAGKEPFYVIDGVPYDSGSLGISQVSGTILPGANISPLSLINPTDIENIVVLKDADATSIYGSRGANGVILITTKNGKSGKTKFSLNTSTGTGQIAGKVQLLNTQEYLGMRKKAFANDGIEEYSEWDYDVNGRWDPNRYTDWQKELIGGTAYISKVQANLSGGSTNTNFALGASHQKETTVFPGDFEYMRSTVHVKLNHHADKERFKILFSANYSVENNSTPGSDLTSQAYNLPPNAPALYNEEGDLNWEDGTWDNPLASLNGKYVNNSNNLLANSVVSYLLSPGLEIKTNLGYTSSKLAERRSNPHTIYNPAYGLDSGSSTMSVNQAERSSWIVEPQVEWKINQGSSKFKILGGSSYQQQIGSSFAQYGVGFPSNALINSMAAASLLSILRDTQSTYRYQAIFGRFNYNYNDTYILNLTGRRDGSSRFGPGNKFANFWAVGGAWVFSEETFMKKMKVLSYGKLRASYGTTGNDQIGDYQYLDTYGISENQYGGTAGLEPSRLFNPDFGWEINKKLEVALEAGFFKDRITFSASYYRNRSSNQLTGIPLPATTGFNSIQANLEALVENRGWEFELNIANLLEKKIKWDSGINITLPKNKLLAFPGLESSTYSNQYVVGESLSIKKLYNVTGVNPQTGIFEIKDYNGDGVIRSADDRQIIKDLSPKLFGGWNNRFSYGNWEMEIFLQFVKQNAINYFYYASPPGTMVNQPTEVLNAWQQQGDDGPMQAYTTGGNMEAYMAYFSFGQSNRIVSDASFIRFKNVSLSYTLPKNIMKGVGCRLYIQGQNLFTITPYKGADPEQISGFLPPLTHLNYGVQLSL